MFQSESPGGNLKTKGSIPPEPVLLFYLYLIFLSAETLNVS